MSQTYAEYSDKKRQESPASKAEGSSQEPSLEALRSGAAMPSSGQMGRRVDLPDAMRSKMENAFGADLSTVKLYESRTVADAGAGAVTQGSSIAFAPGMLDFSSFSGQALLGHELSHVMSQARGEVRGGGFLNDRALEARADREGAMAAAGRQVAMPVTSLSPVTAASASGPMQAGRKEKKEEPKDNWHFSADKSEKGELPSGGIGFILGMNNAADPKHGTEFQNMMAALKGNAVAKGNRRHLGGMAYDAMAANSAEASLKSMEAYRKKLKSEWGNRAERKRQIKILDDMIERARADMTRGRDLQTTTLEGSEFSGAIRGGGVNQVYRYARGEQGAEKGAYFKPDKPGANEVEAYMMDYTGIDKPGEGRGPHLSDREIAFSRLGALLGTSVTLDSKKATLGEGTPTGRQDPRSGRSFEPTAGTSGAVTEEAKGKSWLDFNWRYYGIGSADESDYPPNPMRVLLDPPNDSGTNVGSRLDRAEGVLQPTTTERGSFGGRALLGDDAFSDFFGELDMADPDYQRQMNELFLLDTLAGHLDRHAGNFMINRGEDGKIGVKAIDNDLTFGKKTPFGKKGGAVHYGGLPEQMQIDARMAQRIGSIDHDTLVTTFSDVLTREEIAALEERFGKMKKYIQALAKEDPSLLVEQWNEDTAKREFRLAGGINSAQHENDPGAKGYSGNNYFQRQMLMLNAADMRNQTLYNAAKGLFDPDE